MFPDKETTPEVPNYPDYLKGLVTVIEDSLHTIPVTDPTRSRRFYPPRMALDLRKEMEENRIEIFGMNSLAAMQQGRTAESVMELEERNSKLPFRHLWIGSGGTAAKIEFRSDTFEITNITKPRAEIRGIVYQGIQPLSVKYENDKEHYAGWEAQANGALMFDLQTCDRQNIAYYWSPERDKLIYPLIAGESPFPYMELPDEVIPGEVVKNIIFPPAPVKGFIDYLGIKYTL